MHGCAHQPQLFQGGCHALYSIVTCVCPVQIYATNMSDVDLTRQTLTTSDGAFMTEITVNPADGTTNMRMVCRSGHRLHNVASITVTINLAVLIPSRIHIGSMLWCTKALYM